MKELLNKLTFIKNIVGFAFIGFYLFYVVVNLLTNKGNFQINLALLVIALIYALVYFYTAFIEVNKKINKLSKKIFTNSKKIIGVINAFLIITSVVVNDFNSLFSVLLACLTIGLYLFYLSIIQFLHQLI